MRCKGPLVSDRGSHVPSTLIIHIDFHPPEVSDAWALEAAPPFSPSTTTVLTHHRHRQVDDSNRKSRWLAGAYETQWTSTKFSQGFLPMVCELSLSFDLYLPLHCVRNFRNYASWVDPRRGQPPSIEESPNDEVALLIGHGYGQSLPVKARVVPVADQPSLVVSWAETTHAEPLEFEVTTANMDAGPCGIRPEDVQRYVDCVANYDGQEFVKEYFRGSDTYKSMLMILFDLHRNRPTDLTTDLRRMILSRCLATSLSFVTRGPANVNGKVEDPRSFYVGKTVAPVAIHLELRHRLATLSRDLLEKILRRISASASVNVPGATMGFIFVLFFLELDRFDNLWQQCSDRPTAMRCEYLLTTAARGINHQIWNIAGSRHPLDAWNTSADQHVDESKAAYCHAIGALEYQFRGRQDYLNNRINATFDPENFESLNDTYIAAVATPGLDIRLLTYA